MRAVALLLLAAQAAAENFAVIAVGSQGYGNYRHQANGCHAYRILIKRGLKPENIVLMSYDDVAASDENPFPGKLFNRPTGSKGGDDVYAGCKIDYSGDSYTPDLFISVITGDAEAVKKATGKDKVLRSGAGDQVFLNFIDHGGPGIIAFPNDELLTAKKLDAAIAKMRSKQMYKQLLFYMEACESGSMFPQLPSDGKAIAVTAANGHESSWGTYCPPNDVIAGTDMDTCLGDLFSINWMEDADKEDVSKETIQQQIAIVKKETDKSHVQVFGDTSFQSETLSNFLGAKSPAQVGAGLEQKPAGSVQSQDASLHRHYYKYQRASTSKDRRATWKALTAAILEREHIKEFFEGVAAALAGGALHGSEDLMERKETLTDLDCHNSLVEAISGPACRKKWASPSGYGNQFVQVLVNACESRGSTPVATLAARAAGQCAGTTVIV